MSGRVEYRWQTRFGIRDRDEVRRLAHRDECISSRSKSKPVKFK